jgi:hypothetical protein
VAEQLSPELVAQILSQADELKRARVQNDIANRPFQVQRLVLDLSTVRLESDPLPISFPFRSIFVQDATDTNVSVNFRPTTTDSIQSYFGLKKNDSWNVETAISRGYLHWAAQAGKTITLVFFTDAEFKSGSQISVNSGGVSIANGDTISTAVVALSAATASQLFAASSTRKRGLIQNNTGASIWLGPSTVTNAGATIGLEIQAGDTYVHSSAAAIYGYSVAGGNCLTFIES